jgi:5'-phosphate synthase pdxT subunit
MKIGVLALQGAFIEHQAVLQKMNIETIQVRLPGDLDGLNGLIIPGGESTTIGKLAVAYGLIDAMRTFAGIGGAIWGTCAGAIFLSKDALRKQPLLNLMDITVERNAFGRQVDSFETDLTVDVLKKVDPTNKPYHAVFIRAPLITEVREPAVILARLPESAEIKGGNIVAAQQGRLLATSFHPELTEDDRFHRYFLELAK